MLCHITPRLTWRRPVTVDFKTDVIRRSRSTVCSPVLASRIGSHDQITVQYSRALGHRHGASLNPFPCHRITFKVFVTEVEQEISQVACGRFRDDIPFRIELIEPQIVGNLVELSPSRSQLAESALPAIPPFIVYIAYCISPHVIEL